MITKKKLIKKTEFDKKRKRRVKIIRLVLLIILLFLVNTYVLLGIWYNDSKFTITLDSENGEIGALLIYEDPSDKSLVRTLYLDNDMKYFTDISGDWISPDVDNEKNGSHNGKYYLAYTFYVENSTTIPVDYWAKINVEDVVKNVDEAVRVRVYKNGEAVTYAKRNNSTNEPEKNTEAFYSEDNENEIVMLVENAGFEEKSVDKYTIVVWVEGDDPDCQDEIVGGEIKLKMTITEVLQEKDNDNDNDNDNNISSIFISENEEETEEQF